MFGWEIGLTAVPTPLLEKALRSLHRGELVCPLDISRLAAVGLQDVGPQLLAGLRGLDAAGVRAVLVAVIAERKGLKSPGAGV